jgi:hypothetical protein
MNLSGRVNSLPEGGSLRQILPRVTLILEFEGFGHGYSLKINRLRAELELRT